MVGKMNDLRFVHLLKSDEVRQKFKDLIKAILLSFLAFLAIDYISIIVGFISGYIDLEKIIVPSTVSTISLPFFSYIFSAILPFLIFRDVLKYRRKISYKQFCFFIAFIAIEIIVIYAFLGHWIKANIGTIKDFLPFNGSACWSCSWNSRCIALLD
jgi:hypothetical protein